MLPLMLFTWGSISLGILFLICAILAFILFAIFIDNYGDDLGASMSFVAAIALAILLIFNTFSCIYAEPDIALTYTETYPILGAVRGNNGELIAETEIGTYTFRDTEDIWAWNDSSRSILFTYGVSEEPMDTVLVSFKLVK